MAQIAGSSIVTKCAQLMDVLSSARKPLGFSEIVDQTGFVKSSCHRILAVLIGENLITYDKDSRTYRTGPRLHLWARSAWRKSDLQQAASDTITTLAEGAGMNAALSVLDGDAILYLHIVDTFQMRFSSRAGDHAPLHCTAAGKVFLAHMSEARLYSVLDSLRLEKFTEHTNVTREDVLGELPVIRERGFAQALEEELLQVTGVAAPIFDAQDQLAACLSLWSLADNAGPEAVIAHSDKVIAAANSISARLGWTGADTNIAK